MAKVIRIIGYIVLVAGVALMVLGIAGIWLQEGFAAVQETLSPFNIWNYVAAVITLGPGILLIMLADRLDEKKRRKG